MYINDFGEKIFQTLGTSFVFFKVMYFLRTPELTDTKVLIQDDGITDLYGNFPSTYFSLMIHP
jgi:hypothetical protein